MVIIKQIPIFFLGARIVVCTLILGLIFFIQPTQAIAQNDSPLIKAVEISPNNQMVLIGYSSGLVEIRAINGETLILAIEDHTAIVRDVVWNVDGTEFATVSGDGTVRRWRTSDGQELALYLFNENGFTIDWSYQANKIIAGAIYGTNNLNIWDATTNQLLYAGEQGVNFPVETAPDGNKIAVGSIDIIQIQDSIVLEPDWNAMYFTEIENATQNRWVIVELSWSPDSQYLGIGFLRNQVRIWDTVAHQVIFDMPTSEVQYSDVGSTINVAFSQDGSRISSIAGDGTWRVWDIASGEMISSQKISEVPISAADLSNDFKFYVYATTQQEIEIFDVGGLLEASSPTPTATPTEPSVSCDYQPMDAAELVADISSANGTPEADTICLAENATYTLTSANNSLNALPLVTSEIIVEGNGATIIRDGAAPNFRFFEVASTGNLTLNDLTLSNGNTTGNQGGAIRNAGGVITLNEVIFTQNSSNTGGAIDSDSGIMTINNSTFANNTAQYGGAIDNDAASTMTITGGIFSNNTATYDGGAIQNDGGQMSVLNSFLNTNSANRYGGGVENSGTLTITNSTLSENIALKRGGGISNFGILTLNGNSELLNNQASTGEGWGGGLMNQTNATATLTDVLIQGNSAAQHGGGIRNHASLNLTNVVIEQNTTTQAGGGIFNVSAGNISASNLTLHQNSAGTDGGGLYNSSSNSVVTFQSSRLEGNMAGNRGGFGYLVGTVTITDTQILSNTSTNQGGGAYISSSATVSAQNSCIVGNSATAIFKGSGAIQNWQGNWWGAETGAGNSVTSNTIDTSNFLTTGCPLP